MPAPTMKSFALQVNRPVKDIEKYWDKAQGIASKKFKKKDDTFYAYTTGILKKMLGIKESKLSDKIIFKLSDYDAKSEE